MIGKQNVIDKLNQAIKLDRNLIEKLVDTRYEVTSEYFNSEDFVCMETGAGRGEAGMIGVLNSVLDINDGWRIAANYDDRGKLIDFVLVKY